ncbi:MAG TPA: sarcosine oxidase subunit gamma, partial [Mycobacterium sp.]
KVFGSGAAVQTILGQAAVVLIPLSDNGTDYRILVRSSFARHLAEWLIDAAEEFGDA